MKGIVSYEVKCESCSAQSSLGEEQLNPIFCPKCGKSEKLLLTVSVNEIVKVAEDSVSVIGKDQSLPSKKKRRLEYASGKSLTADTGE
jgi:DNA-directed RNA polymerase subunit RPC12/RpoP